MYFINGFLRGIQRYKELNYNNIIQRVAKLLLIVIFWYFYKLNVEVIIIAIVASSLLSRIYGISKLRKEVKINWAKASFTQFKHSLSFGLKEQLGYFFSYFSADVDLLILASFIDRESLGIYALALGFSALFQMVPNTFGVVLLPKISRATLEGGQSVVKRSILANSVILVSGFIIFIVTGKWLIPLIYGTEFSGTYSLAIPIILGQIFSSNGLIINKYFSGIGKPEIKSIVRAINIPIKVSFLFFLVSSYGITGAAYAYAVGSVSLLMLTVLFYFKITK
jgi:O-antigen/teichoic acid export membrane protein